MTNEKFETVLAHLTNAINELQEAKDIAGEKDKLSILDMLIDKTSEAIGRWNFRQAQLKGQ